MRNKNLNFEWNFIASNYIAGGGQIEIANMLHRLKNEKKEKEKEIQRLEDIQTLEEMTLGPVQSGMLCIDFVDEY